MVLPCLVRPVLASAATPPPAFRLPTLHNRPQCIRGPRAGGWHDIAAALTLEGRHHVWQGCPPTGWNHAVSDDLVSWRNVGVLSTLGAGGKPMEMLSGFMTLDQHGVACAGFRPEDPAPRWPTGLRLRCALDGGNASRFGPMEQLFPVPFYRRLPFDPISPWLDGDGKLYATAALDGCNGTTPPCQRGRCPPCAAGGQIALWVSDTGALHGPSARWRQIDPLFASNRDVLPGVRHEEEFVTPNFIGALPGEHDRLQTIFLAGLRL
eukprot:COSAG04_NODE_1507_length_6504_cov_1.860734_3_plen_265_part_00